MRTLATTTIKLPLKVHTFAIFLHKNNKLSGIPSCDRRIIPKIQVWDDRGKHTEYNRHRLNWKRKIVSNWPEWWSHWNNSMLIPVTTLSIFYYFSVNYKLWSKYIFFKVQWIKYIYSYIFLAFYLQSLIKSDLLVHIRKLTTLFGHEIFE